MRKQSRVAVVALAVVAAMLTLAACTGDSSVDENAYSQVDSKASSRTPYLPTNDVEFSNYNKAQQLYDSPDSIIWCTTTWGNASAPLVTIPVAGKLTSSSVSYFPNEKVTQAAGSHWLTEARSVDGMFHGSPPAYRYGFTPGGQYVDFSNMPTFCTTALTEFQRQSTSVTITNDDLAAQLQAKAEEALKNGDADEAQRILEGIK